MFFVGIFTNSTFSFSCFIFNLYFKKLCQQFPNVTASVVMSAASMNANRSGNIEAVSQPFQVKFLSSFFFRFYDKA